MGETRYFELNITADTINPDCSYFSTKAILINHQLPGPTLSVDKGDRVQVLVRNLLPNTSHSEISIHFHGIRQYGSVEADGVPYLTQRPIPPGQSFLHDFRVVNQAGTFFYHAHVGLAEQTAFGAFVVHDQSENYPEQIILLSEWWHRSRRSFQRFIMGPEFDDIPEAESVLVNGRTVHRPDRIAPHCDGYTVMNVVGGHTYLLRIIGATTFRTYGFGIQHHNLTIVEVDGEPVKPYVVSFVEVAPGQRFSVLLHADQDSRDYTIQTIRRLSGPIEPKTNGMALMSYDGKTAMGGAVVRTPHIESSMFPREEGRFWVWPELQPLYGVDPIVYRDPSRTIKLRSTEERMEDGTLRWFINKMAYMEPQVPILTDILRGRRPLPDQRVFLQDHGGYDPYLGTYPLAHYEIVDIVFQNTFKDKPCRSHPWHTHGHSHWEIANGPGEYDHARDGQIRNVKTPIEKDVTMVYPYPDHNLARQNGTTTGCGWSKIRLIADNPGVWAVHCHNTPHMLMGMMVVFEEAPELIRTRISKTREREE
ncbi:hypothetical protein DFQ28_002935 [Apophysomyces sp. BC1034]|nr:hypothetical protein DFQ30_009683 [Apophysomyces sp. BC1015]KAG0180661.1 hypothetical protein DFQ29_000221 [Apophysomyces sp. BC1021]KAG0194860.1 hypothetical protein DFQ28_002935 [Apophysomyces sp. BC1034]